MLNAKLTPERQFINMKKLSILLGLLLVGCASPDHYGTYVEAQKSLSRDATVAEAARIAALTEMVKSSDNTVRIEAIRALQEIQRSKRQVIIQQPKGLFGK